MEHTNDSSSPDPSRKNAEVIKDVAAALSPLGALAKHWKQPLALAVAIPALTAHDYHLAHPLDDQVAFYGSIGHDIKIMQHANQPPYTASDYLQHQGDYFVAGSSVLYSNGTTLVPLQVGISGSGNMSVSLSTGTTNLQIG